MAAADLSLLRFSLGNVSDLIYRLATEQTNLSRGFKEDLKQLSGRGRRIEHFLEDGIFLTWSGDEVSSLTTEDLLRTDEGQTWLKRVRDATCRAENMLDEFAYEDHRREMENQIMWNKVRNFVSLSLSRNSLAFGLKMAVKLMKINSLFDGVLKEGYKIGLGGRLYFYKQIAEPSEPSVVGRDGDVSVLIDMLLGSSNMLQDDDDLSVVAIVGMAGLGKTTLARLVYNDHRVVECFDHRMWVNASDDVDVVRVLKDMVETLTGCRPIASHREELGKNLYGKKYLLVLDDVWLADLSIWENIRSWLRAIRGSKGSKILVTTRNMDVVSAMHIWRSLTHHLDKLDYDDSWTMFRDMVFAEGGPVETQNLVEIGRRMVEKCKGVPSAVKSLALSLHYKRSEDEWVSIENLEKVEDQNDNLLASRKSYNHLPSLSLKQCFAFCSIFPKGFSIEKDDLIYLWLALGYIQPLDRPRERWGLEMEMEDVGNEYINSLLQNSLFQDVERDEYNNITSCKMQDHVHDLAVRVSEVHCLTSEPSELKDHPEFQHLSLEFWEEATLEIPEENIVSLRTLFISGHLPKIIVDINYVRALALSGYDVEKLPSSVAKFKHLRYLDLSDTSIQKLPNFISKFYFLQTLKLPWDLIELPKDFHKLVNLRHYYIVDTVKTRKLKLMPMSLGQLTSLRTIPFFVVGEDSGYRIEELGKLSKLRGRLHVYGLQHIKDKDEASKANISAKEHIQELGLHWDADCGKFDINHEDVVEGLIPHRNLKGLILENFGGRGFPSWMRTDYPSLLNVVKIELRYCRLWEQIPPLGHLPFLEIIEMVGFDNVRRIGPEFCGYNERERAKVLFPALRKFTLDGMPMLEEWSVPAGTRSFPCLEHLYISGCPKLTTIPSHLLSIRELTISTIDLSNAEMGKMCHPSLTICSTYWDSRKVDSLIEDLWEKSSGSLRNLTIRGLNELHYLPNKIWNLTSLEKLEIIKCSNLVFDIEETKGFNGLISLQQLSINCCEKLACLPKGLLLETLLTLEIDSCPEVTMAPDELWSLTSLQRLKIVHCPRLASFGEEERLLFLTSLQRLEIGAFSEELEYFPWPSTSVDGDIQRYDHYPSTSATHHHRHLHHRGHPQQYSFISLTSLHLQGWEKLTYLPDELQYLTGLIELSIHNFHGLEALPEWLGNLSSLRSLELCNCKNLRSLPKQRLRDLLQLTIENCPLLMKRCEKGVSREWRKVAHIPLVETLLSAQE